VDGIGKRDNSLNEGRRSIILERLKKSHETFRKAMSEPRFELCISSKRYRIITCANRLRSILAYPATVLSPTLLRTSSLPGFGIPVFLVNPPRCQPGRWKSQELQISMQLLFCALYIQEFASHTRTTEACVPACI